VVVVVAAGAQGTAAVVLAEAGTQEVWDTAVATVRVTAAALDSATPALGIRGTTLCQRGAPIRKTLPTKAEIIMAEAFPATAARLHSLAQHHTAHSSKAHQVVQVDDTLPGKKKGFVDALPPGQELQADRGRALNPDTIRSDLDDIVARGLPPGLELNLDRGKSLPPGWQAKLLQGPSCLTRMTFWTTMTTEGSARSQRSICCVGA
jgi:hypothetical protein